MPKPTNYGKIIAEDGHTVGLTINPAKPGHAGRYVIYRLGPFENGKTRSICTTDDPHTADWIVERLRIAEAHSPDTRTILHSDNV